MSYRRLKKSKRFLERYFKYSKNLLKQRLRGPGARTVRILRISEDEPQQTNEAQFDPLWINSEGLRERLGVVIRPVRFGRALRIAPAALGRFDVVGIQFFFRTPAEEVERIVDTLRARISPHAKLVYFDGDDDLGILWPQLLKKVDLYVKNHLMRDRSFYLRSTIGKNNLTDYVATHHGISFDSDPFPCSVPVPDPADLEKLFLGWNIGTSKYIYNFLKKSGDGPASGRDIDVSCRVTIPAGSWLTPLRLGAIGHLANLAGEYRIVATTDRIPPSEFQDELRRSRICVSPFGHGEICFRDFEAVLRGCLLVKPDMGHLETRPDIYIPGETYVPVRWDFADLAEKCRYYLDHEDERARIAARAACVLREFYDKNTFVDSFGQLLDRLGLRDRPAVDPRRSHTADTR
ncbi:MAG: glycosyltransferase [Isosphaeraceae bacterium]